LLRWAEAEAKARPTVRQVAEEGHSRICRMVAEARSRSRTSVANRATGAMVPTATAAVAAERTW
jgi:hypothetical protein